MIDFDKKTLNSDKFREAAIFFEKNDAYCLYPSGTTEYRKYWERETERCLEGFTAKDGDWISGYNYFYLNYCPILRLIEEPFIDRSGKTKIRKIRDRSFPRFYDYDRFYFEYIQDCEEDNAHGAVLKARGKGYSFKGGSMLCRNYFLIPASKSYAVASEKEFLTKDGLLSKAFEIMDFIDKNTAWAKKRLVDREMHVMSGVEVTDELGNKTKQGYLSEIIGISLKDKPDRIRGKRGKLILWEEAGMFKDILTGWTIARPGMEEDGWAFGLMVAYGTGGSEGDDFEGLRELFYNTDGYNIHGVPNIWDDNVPDTQCGFFVPAWSNSTASDADGKQFCMDDQGNSLKGPAMKFVHEERQKVVEGATNSQAVDRYVAEHPIRPQEACLELTGNIFPKKELQQQLSMIRTNKKLKSHKQVGDLIWDGNGGLIWKQKKGGDIVKYPLGKEDDPTGSIVIWEHPCDEPPLGLYIAGCLTPGEQVMTDIGLMNVEDVDYSRKLINKDGEQVSINALLRYEKYDINTYSINMSNTLSPTRFTGEHPIYATSKIDGEYGFVKAETIKRGDWIKIPNTYRRYIEPPKALGSIMTPELWRFIGMWLGDGWVSRNRVCMSFNAIDTDCMYRYIDSVEKMFSVKTSRRLRDGSYEVTFGHAALVDYLTDNFGKGVSGKVIPEWAKYIDNDSKLEIVRGYLDADGYVYHDSKRNHYGLEFVSINLDMLQGFQDILFSLGVASNLGVLRKAKMSSIMGRTVSQKETYHLRVGNQDTLDFCQAFDFDKTSKVGKIDLNNIVRAPRRRQYCYFSDDLMYIHIQVKDVKVERYTGTVYNFDCETHTYMCRYITTHNCDPYDHDQAGTNSLGSTFIYKRFQNFEEYYDIIVAEYTGRPATAEDYYENVRKLLIYYNARLLYENERKGIFPYFTNKHCDYLLLDQPDIISDIIKNSKVQRSKGIHMTKQIRDYGEGLIKEWLNEEISPGKKNLTRIQSEPLLEELIKTNGVMNVDRVIALIMVMLYREQVHNLKVKEVESTVRSQRLFDLPLFTEQWFNGADAQTDDGIPVFTF